MPAQALIIDEPWITQIIEGRKTWEMRSRPTTKRGRIGLIRKSSGTVVATATVVDCLAPLTTGNMLAHFTKHQIPQEVVTRANYKWFTPWVLADVRPLAHPVRYRHPSGAVTWVDLAPEVQARLQALGGDTLMDGPVPEPAREAESMMMLRTSKAASVARPEAAVHGGISIELTGGNIRNKHFYWRAARHLLPTDAIGGSKKTLAGAPIIVAFELGDVVASDIDGEKMILRDRAATRRFFEQAAAREGDTVILRRTGERSFAVGLARTAS